VSLIRVYRLKTQGDYCVLRNCHPRLFSETISARIRLLRQSSRRPARYLACPDLLRSYGLGKCHDRARPGAKAERVINLASETACAVRDPLLILISY
jgi:hypothetical protein